MGSRQSSKKVRVRLNLSQGFGSLHRPLAAELVEHDPFLRRIKGRQRDTRNPGRDRAPASWTPGLSHGMCIARIVYGTDPTQKTAYRKMKVRSGRAGLSSDPPGSSETTAADREGLGKDLPKINKMSKPGNQTTLLGRTVHVAPHPLPKHVPRLCFPCFYRCFTYFPPLAGTGTTARSLGAWGDFRYSFIESRLRNH